MAYSTKRTRRGGSDFMRQWNWIDQSTELKIVVDKSRKMQRLLLCKLVEKKNSKHTESKTKEQRSPRSSWTLFAGDTAVSDKLTSVDEFFLNGAQLHLERASWVVQNLMWQTEIFRKVLRRLLKPTSSPKLIMNDTNASFLPWHCFLWPVGSPKQLKNYFNNLGHVLGL